MRATRCGSGSRVVTSRLGAPLPRGWCAVDRGVNVMNAFGSSERRLTSGPADEFPAWSPDGRRVAFTRRSRQPSACDT